MKGDWYNSVISDLKDFKIDLPFSEIKQMKKSSFKKLVKGKANEAALNYLNSLKLTHSKLDNLKYSELQIQPYLINRSIYTPMAQQVFNWRTRMANFRSNFSHGNEDLTCPMGCLHLDSQENILKCEIIQDNIDIDVSSVNYFNIFSSDIQKMKLTFEVLQKVMKIRKEIVGDETIGRTTTRTDKVQ